jgi:hypothetical protein
MILTPAQLLSLQSKVKPALLKPVLEGNPGDYHRFVVELTSQANLASLPDGLTRFDRRQQVVTLLQDTARQGQAEMLTFLQVQQAEGRVQQFRPFCILNGLAATADADILLALATRSEVRIIRQDHWRR